MADFNTLEGVADFHANKRAQGEAAMASGIRGVQFVHTGRSYALICSTDDFYEAVCIGQEPRPETETYRDPANRRQILQRELPDSRKQLKNKAIDLTDEQIVDVLDKWASRQTAFDLPFVIAVWGIDGMARVKA